ncbi:S-adenosyl-L-methionine-dependent methyltransferase [Zopfochytrium polystomum]|nr:S-adenosyl-L-methionine-dependent methyltransferase [Zopfochytrium polystomum]
MSHLLRAKYLPHVAFGTFCYFTGTYTAFHVHRIWKLPPPEENAWHPDKQASCTHAYTALAPIYDNKIGWDEWLMGLHGKRKKLIAMANGNVCEIAAGTGRNLQYYQNNKAVTGLTLTDSNPQMLQEAFGKFKESKGHGMPPTHFSLLDIVEYGQLGTAPQGEASASGSPSDRGHLADGKFDTVVDTFGLCSMSDPVAGLRGMSRLAGADGRILLLEHGRSRPGESFVRRAVRSSWLVGQLNVVLDKTAPDHARQWGCWWNRDIEELVERAGLEVVSARRYHFGTTVLIEARRSPEPASTLVL